MKFRVEYPCIVGESYVEFASYETSARSHFAAASEFFSGLRLLTQSKSGSFRVYRGATDDVVVAVQATNFCPPFGGSCTIGCKCDAEPHLSQRDCPYRSEW